jgi:hypothetical protein
MSSKVSEEKKEVLEGWSIDYCCIVTQSGYQEEVEDLLDLTWKDLIFHRHTVECAVMQYPWWGHPVPTPLFLSNLNEKETLLGCWMIF